MPETYHGILDGDRIQWIGPRPPSGRVAVTPALPNPKLDSASPGSGLPESTPEQRAAMVDALDELARVNAFSSIEDPVAWQREIRRDRPLPGREE
jgi:hypothetical protein